MSRFRVDHYQDGRFHQGFCETHFFGTIEDATERWLQVGWECEEMGPGDAGETWDAAQALLSEAALTVDQDTGRLVQVISFRETKMSRLPLAVIFDVASGTTSTVRVEDRELTMA